MIEFNTSAGHPGLLVSVRNAEEAVAALAGGANVIDVKEPRRGSLGAAEAHTIAEVVQAVQGRAPVTVAAGELLDFAAAARNSSLHDIPQGVSLFKLGLAGCQRTSDWQQLLLRTIAFVLEERGMPRPVAVAYADWQAAHAPDPRDVLSFAAEHDFAALLVDTWGKTGGDLFDAWPHADLREFVGSVRSRSLPIVLAGSLVGPSIRLAANLGPDLVAVRTAACQHGRNGTVTAERVTAIQRLIALGESAAVPQGEPVV